MRGILAVWLAVLLAGCLGGAGTPADAPTPVRPDGHTLRVLVTNDELVPIAGAIALVDDRPQPALGDDVGEILLENVSAGRHTLRLWAPQHYRSMEDVTLDPAQADATFNAILQRRPDDRIMPEVHLVDGQCFLAMRSGQGVGEVGCLAKPSSERNPPPPSFRLALTNKTEDGVLQRFHDVDLRFRWGTEELDQLPSLEARMEPDGTFPDGRRVITFEGKGPFTFRLRADALDPSLLDGRHAIRLAPVPADDGRPRVLFGVDFHIDAVAGIQYVAPANPPWQG